MMTENEINVLIEDNVKLRFDATRMTEKLKSLSASLDEARDHVSDVSSQLWELQKKYIDLQKTLMQKLY